MEKFGKAPANSTGDASPGTAGLVLVTGATGYVGGRLVPHLLKLGYRVRVLVRDAGRLGGRPWLGQVEVCEGDVFIPASLVAALDEVHIAYYLIHSMMISSDFYTRDIVAAENFGRTAAQAGVQRIIYLGGLGDSEDELSPHLRSRQQTGDILRKSGIPVTEFRAAVIVGSGSASFEMIRYLTERLPLMICPRWVYSRVQPIGIQDVLDYLAEALTVPQSTGEIIEIGGADVLTYRGMMLGYAHVRGLRRALFRVPVLTPTLSSYWIHWVTPIPAEMARPLIEGLRNEVVLQDHKAASLFPRIQPADYQTSVREALDQLNASHIETTWSDSLASSQGDLPSLLLKSTEGMIIERRQISVQASPEEVFSLFTRLGGKRGWPYMNRIWRLRGTLDRLLGGVGFRRGRRDPDRLRIGDALDFWRVEAVESPNLLRLRAEMKVPGSAWLQFNARPIPVDRCLLSQTAYFAPKGLAGFLYWYLLYPIHSLIFSGTIRALAEQAEQPSRPHPNLGIADGRS